MDTGKSYSLLLLAGGKSRRMGTDKASLLYGGKTFAELIIEKRTADWYLSGGYGKEDRRND